MKLILVLYCLTSVLLVVGEKTNTDDPNNSLKKLSAGYYSSGSSRDAYSTYSRSPYYNSQYKPPYSSYSSTASTSNSLDTRLDSSVQRQQSLCDQIESNLNEVKLEISQLTNLNADQLLIREDVGFVKSEPSVYELIQKVSDQCQLIKLQVKLTRQTVKKFETANLNEVKNVVESYQNGQNNQYDLLKGILLLKKRCTDLKISPASTDEKISNLLDTMINQAAELKHESIKQLESIFMALQSQDKNKYLSTNSYIPKSNYAYNPNL